MRYLHFILPVMFCLISGGVAGAQELEQFRLKSGEDPIQAKPLSWDFQTGSLMLELADGTSREVPASELHSADMRLVEKIMTKQMLAGRRGEPVSGVTSKTLGSDRSASVDRIHGVRWLADENVARKIASGGEGPNDDRPLVWFRVLGDMTGFM